MHPRWLEDGTELDARRGETVVCVTADSGLDGLADSLRSLLARTPPSVAFLVCAGPPTESIVSELDRRRDVRFVSPDLGAGASSGLGRAIAAAAPADVIVVNAGCVVADAWFEGLRTAACGDSRTATASALPIESVLGHKGQSRAFDDAARAVMAQSLRLRPRVSAALSGCVYVRRSALELAGAFDQGFFERCLINGLSHVVADDVLVHGPAPAPVAAVSSDMSERPARGPFGRSLGAARRALRPLSILIDARVLAGPMNGTQVHVLELVGALAARRDADVGAIVAADLGGEARELLDALPQVTLTSVTAARSLAADLVHRPFQVASPADLAVLAHVAGRLIVTHQDLITYHNPSYFPSPEEWAAYRRTTETALSVADRVLFFSRYVRDDALAEGLVEPNRASVVPIGVDHAVTGREQHGQAPAGAASLADDAEVMLCLGTDYRHKNRTFVLRMLAELQRRHDWRGRVVLAGSHVAFGSSAEDERRLLEADPQLRGAVIDLGAVTEAEKGWLLRRARVVVYPSLYEGFGLIPFEAAECGIPCLWAPGTALGETLSDADAPILPWDATATAERALELMRDDERRVRNVEVVRHAGARLRWQETAARLIEVYRSVCDEPPTPAGTRERGGGVMRGGLSEDAMRLVGPDGALPVDLERPLLALATHPKLAAPVFAAIKAGYRASYRRRRGGSQNGR